MSGKYWNKRYKSKWRYQIVPVTPVGVVMFLISLALVISGAFSFSLPGFFIPPMPGVPLFITGLGLFVYAIIFKTDYSE